MKAEVYDVIVWENAAAADDRILATIRERFDVRGVFRMRWSRESFRENLVRFYSHSQKHLDSRRIRRVMHGKMKHCGDGDFLLIVFLDPAPAYGPKQTSSGERTVNTNVFDLKMELRDWVGGGHKVHASDDPSETRKDLTLLFGEEHEQRWAGTGSVDDGDELPVHRDVTGVKEFASLGEMFALLDVAMPYVVLRNFEGIESRAPGEDYSEDHADIDVLVDDLMHVVHLLGARKAARGPGRVHYAVRIAGESVLFDFRFAGDGYMDRTWQAAILSERARHEDFCHVPDPENHFYSLLYHALLHKNEIAIDYRERLTSMGRSLGVWDQIADADFAREARRVLDLFMKRHGYDYTEPTDLTVIYNTQNVSDAAPASLRRAGFELFWRSAWFAHLWKTASRVKRSLLQVR